MPTATLIDANNVRGTMSFPDLDAFSSAVRHWALEEQTRGSPLQVLAIDHGESAEAIAVDGALAVAFAGEKTDADTVIAHAVDWLLRESSSRTSVVVVTSDHLLRQRCTHELPSGDGAPFGPKRPSEELRRLRFEGSAAFGQALNGALAFVTGPLIGNLPGRGVDDDPFAASPPPQRQQQQQGEAAGATISRRARKRAEGRAEARRYGSSNERTADRCVAAARLHSRVRTRVSDNGDAATGSGGRRGGSSGGGDGGASWLLPGALSTWLFGAQRQDGKRCGGGVDGLAPRFVAWYAGSPMAIRPSYLPAHAVGGAVPFDGAFATVAVTPSTSAAAAAAAASDASNPPLDALCCYRRLKPGTSALWLPLLALYAPLGLCLVAARLVVLAVAALLCATLSWAGGDGALTEAGYAMTVRLLCAGLGFFVRVGRGGDASGDMGGEAGGKAGGRRRGGRAGGKAVSKTMDDSTEARQALQRAAVIVCNHVSQWDGLPLRLLTPCATVVRETYTPAGVAGSRLNAASCPATTRPPGCRWSASAGM